MYAVHFANALESDSMYGYCVCSGFIRGELNEKPQLVAFQPHCQTGALLTVVRALVSPILTTTLPGTTIGFEVLIPSYVLIVLCLQCWSSGRISHIPMFFTSNDDMATQSVPNMMTSQASINASLYTSLTA